MSRRTVRNSTGRTPIAGYREMRRVARRVVAFHFDTSRLDADFWRRPEAYPDEIDLGGRLLIA